jgi:hypothetical protein
MSDALIIKFFNFFKIFGLLLEVIKPCRWFIFLQSFYRFLEHFLYVEGVDTFLWVLNEERTHNIQLTFYYLASYYRHCFTQCFGHFSLRFIFPGWNRFCFLSIIRRGKLLTKFILTFGFCSAWGFSSNLLAEVIRFKNARWFISLLRLHHLVNWKHNRANDLFISMWAIILLPKFLVADYITDFLVDSATNRCRWLFDLLEIRYKAVWSSVNKRKLLSLDFFLRQKLGQNFGD